MPRPRARLVLAGVLVALGAGRGCAAQAPPPASAASAAAVAKHVLRADDACAAEPGGGLPGGGARCALGALQLKAQVAITAAPADKLRDHAREDAAAEEQPQQVLVSSNGSWAEGPVFPSAAGGDVAAASAGLEPQQLLQHLGQARVTAYEQADLLWDARGEGLPFWLEVRQGAGFSDSLGRERVSLVVPISGGSLLVSCFLALLISRAWLTGWSAREKKNEPGENVKGGSFDGSVASTSGEPPESLSPATHTPDQPEPPRASTASFLRFASRSDKMMLAVAAVCSSIQGCARPAIFLFCDNMFNAINLPNDDGTIPPTPGPHTNRDEASMKVAHLFFVLAAVTCFARFFAVILTTHAADHMAFALKKAYFNRLLQQGPAWHDVNDTTELSSRLAQDAWAFKEACGEQLLNTFRSTSMFVASVLLSFSKDWQMASLMCVALPIAGFATATTIAIVREFSKAQSKIHITAGSIAESAFQMIRTVTAFNGQRRTLSVYGERLEAARVQGETIGVVSGFCMGIISAVISFALSMGMYAGSLWIMQGYERECWVSDPPFGDCRTGGKMISCMFTLLWGFTMGPGALAVSIEAISRGKEAAQRMYDVIDQPLVVDTSSGGRVLDYVEGAIAYEHVRFSYPGRLMSVALNSVSLRVPAGTTAAFVGPSGSGKSTLVSLLFRFYDPQGGAVTLDGHDLRFLQVAWLRSRMALVEQEPVLFGCSIAENIAYGYDGSVSQEDIEKAARMANAHDFVCNFPAKYQTEVGERGTQLSGGQKQRIAIARALIRDPAVLLLDEATSALDMESERIVQEALDKLLQAKQRTTLVIAHRLTTVQNADQIFVLQDGQMVEQGKHSELMAKTDSVYAGLAKAQHSAGESEDSGNSPDVDANSDPSATLPDGSPAKAPAQRAVSRQLDRQSSLKAAMPSGKSMIIAGDEKPKPEPRHVPLSRLWRLSRPEYALYVFGFLFTILSALQTPVMCVRLTQVINLFNAPPVVFQPDLGIWVPDFDEKALKEKTGVLCLTMQVVGVIGLISMTSQFWAFNKAGDALTNRLKKMSLEAILRQEIGWFDSNSSGRLAHNLSTDVPQVRALMGSGLAPMLSACLMVVASFGAALVFSWRFTLIILSMCPFLLVGNLAIGYAAMRAAETESAGVVSESIGNVKTVTAFGLQEKLLGRFVGILDGVRAQDMRSRYLTAGATGLANAGSFLINAFTVIFGTKFVDQGVMSPDKAALSLFLLLSGAGALAEIVRWLEASGQGREAVNRVFEILDRQSAINPMESRGQKLPQVEGRIEFQDITFWYPERPDVSIFKGFTLTIEPNTTTALVGHSGSGKSTVVGLLQRFYDPQHGCVRLDGLDIRQLNLPWLRAQMGLVQQEPSLVKGTVLENICYGLGEDPNEEIAIKAAKMANAHAFIMQLPMQYHTTVGRSRSSQFSGGQKQRIAIARAIVLDPAVLLLDEATSALDTASERVVQEALDGLLEAKQRTTVVIAHRLSTVQNADQICVVQKGEILERGRHQELIAKPDGHYTRLIRRQIATTLAPPPGPPETAEK